MNNIKDDKFKIQKMVNELGSRSALARTMKFGESVELSNGVTFILKKRRGSTSATVILLAPNDVAVYWDKGTTMYEE